jgi:branched-chain amino acid transport system permease protein
MCVGYVPQADLSVVTAALPMALLLIVLMVMPEARLALGRIPRMRAPRVASFTQTLIFGGAVILSGVLVAIVLSGSSLATMGQSFALALLALSLVPLSGYAGQVSLCQFTFAGIGALVMHWVDGGSSVLGILAAAAICGAVGVVLALPALRLRGIYLALSTLAFAVLADNVFFNSASVTGESGFVSVGRPDIFGLRFSSMGSYVILLAVVFALAAIAVGAMRRGKFGRRLVALQDSPVASTTVGAGIARSKLLVFAGSAAMAGVAGALWTGIAGSASAQEFQFLASISLFVGLTLAGSRMLSSALLAGLGLAWAPVIGAHLPGLGDFLYLSFGAGIVAIGRNPNALGVVYVKVGDWWRGRRSPLANPALRPLRDDKPVAEVASDG